MKSIFMVLPTILIIQYYFFNHNFGVLFQLNKSASWIFYVHEQVRDFIVLSKRQKTLNLVICSLTDWEITMTISNFGGDSPIQQNCNNFLVSIVGGTVHRSAFVAFELSRTSHLQNHGDDIDMACPHGMIERWIFSYIDIKQGPVLLENFPNFLSLSTGNSNLKRI